MERGALFFMGLLTVNIYTEALKLKWKIVMLSFFIAKKKLLCVKKKQLNHWQIY